MPASGRKNNHLLGKLMLTTALLGASGGYSYWLKKQETPREVVASDSAPAQIAAVGADGNLPYVFHDGPAVAAITMPPGRNVADGEYVSQEWESGFGTVKVKVRIRNGAFTGLDYLLVPDERERSQELSRMSKPLLVHEMIHEQRAKVDVITTATYTSWAFQDALADVVLHATRPRLSERQIEDTENNDAHNLQPSYMGNQ